MGQSNHVHKQSMYNKPLEKYQINIATLNYGVTSSPFEYFNDQNEKQLLDLSKIYQKMKKIYNFEGIRSKNWLEKKFKHQRYSPLYYKNIGINKNDYLDNKQEFLEKWETAYAYYQKKILDQGKYQEKLREIKNQWVQNLKLFDFIIYATIVYYSEKKAENSDAFLDESQMKSDVEEIFKAKTNKKYQQFMGKMFQYEFISNEKRLQKLYRFLKKNEIKVLFLQDGSKIIRKYIEQKTNDYRIVMSPHSNSMILIHWDLCGKMLKEKQYLSLKYYNDCFLKYDELKNQQIDNEIGEGVRLQLDDNLEFENNDRQFIYKKKKIPKSFGQQNDQSAIKDSTNAPRPSQSQMRGGNRDGNESYIPYWMIKQLNVNNDTVVQFLGNLILVSSSLSGNKNEKQQDQLFNVLQKIKKRFPNHIVLAGVDMNKQINCNSHIFDFGPNRKEVFTCMKKRSVLQAQQKKANKEIKQYDYLLLATDKNQERNPEDRSDKLSSAKVIKIDGKQIDQNHQNTLLPNCQHPYDHYIVTASIQFIPQNPEGMKKQVKGYIRK